MDNACPQALKEIIVDKHKNKLELVPPHDHHTNPAEKCIDTFKCHFISGLSNMNLNLPLHLWYHILPQCQDTLNMMRTSRLHPHMSSFTPCWAQFCISGDFHKLMFWFQAVTWAWRCNRKGHSCVWRKTCGGAGGRCASCWGYLDTAVECGTKGAAANLGSCRLAQK